MLGRQPVEHFFDFRPQPPVTQRSVGLNGIDKPQRFRS